MSEVRRQRRLAVVQGALLKIADMLDDGEDQDLKLSAVMLAIQVGEALHPGLKSNPVRGEVKFHLAPWAMAELDMAIYDLELLER